MLGFVPFLTVRVVAERSAFAHLSFFSRNTPPNVFTPRVWGRCVRVQGCVESCRMSANTSIVTTVPAKSIRSLGTHLSSDSHPDIQSDRRWLTVKDAAEQVGVSQDFIYNACSIHGLRHVRLVGRRSIRILRSQLHDWMDSFTTCNDMGVR